MKYIFLLNLALSSYLQIVCFNSPVYKGQTPLALLIKDKMHYACEHNITDPRYMLSLKDEIEEDLTPPHRNKDYRDTLTFAQCDATFFNYCMHITQGDMESTKKKKTYGGHETSVNTYRLFDAYQNFLHRVRIRLPLPTEKLSPNTPYFRMPGHNFIVDEQGEALTDGQKTICWHSAFKPSFYTDLLEVDQKNYREMKKKLEMFLLCNNQLKKVTEKLPPQIIKRVIITKLYEDFLMSEYDTTLNRIHDNLCRNPLFSVGRWVKNYSEWFKERQQELHLVLTFEDVQDSIKYFNQCENN